MRVLLLVMLLRLGTRPMLPSLLPGLQRSVALDQIPDALHAQRRLRGPRWHWCCRPRRLHLRQGCLPLWMNRSDACIVRLRCTAACTKEGPGAEQCQDSGTFTSLHRGAGRRARTRNLAVRRPCAAGPHLALGRCGRRRPLRLLQGHGEAPSQWPALLQGSLQPPGPLRW